MSLETSFPSRECLQVSEGPVLCLRFETSREYLALPYAGLVSIELSLDEATVTISFVTHRITIKGSKLHEAYRAVAAGVAVGLREGRMASRIHSIRVNQPMDADDNNEPMTIRSIQIKVVDPDR